MNLEFHPEAEQEFIEAAIYYETEVPGLGDRPADEVERATELLLDNPELGSPVSAELRHFVLRRFPFSIIYSVSRELLYVVALAHGSREPGYWRPRVTS